MGRGAAGELDKARVWVGRDSATTRKEMARIKQGKLHRLREVVGNGYMIPAKMVM